MFDFGKSIANDAQLAPLTGRCFAAQVFMPGRCLGGMGTVSPAQPTDGRP